MGSATGQWHRSPEGRKLHVTVIITLEEGELALEDDGGYGFTNFHRSLSTYINTFIETGFLLEKIVEPTVTVEQLKVYPELDDELPGA